MAVNPLSEDEGFDYVPRLVPAGTQPPVAHYSAEFHASLAEIEPDSFWFNHRNDVLAAAVSRFPPDGPIFDMGGGNGYVSLGLTNAGFSCIVVEPGPAGADAAAQRGLPVIRASFEDCGFAPETIPAAAMFDVLEHMEDDRAVLTKLNDALTVRGRLYLTVPAYRFLWSHDDVAAGHYRRYTLASLRKLVEQAGFSIEYETYFFTVLTLPIFLMRTVAKRPAARSAAELRKLHDFPAGPVGALLRQSLARELEIIRSGGKRHFGTSCLLVARKH